MPVGTEKYLKSPARSLSSKVEARPTMSGDLDDLTDWAFWFDELSDLLRNRIRHEFGETVDPIDCVRQALLQVLELRDRRVVDGEDSGLTFDTKRHFFRYMLTTARRVAMARLKRSASERPCASVDKPIAEMEKSELEFRDAASHFWTLLDRSELARIADYCQSGLTLAEYAANQGVTSSAASQWFSKPKAKLRNFLAQQGVQLSNLELPDICALWRWYEGFGSDESEKNEE